MTNTKTTRADRSYVCPPEHKHAQTGTCYHQHKCNCEPCNLARLERDRRRRKNIAYGRPTSTLIPAGPVQDHLQMLLDAGVGYRRIATLSGLPHSTIRQHTTRKGKTIQRDHAELILAIRPEPYDPAKTDLWDSRGTHRRIQALCRIGYSYGHIARLMGYAERSRHTAVMAILRNAYVTKGTFDKVSAVYEAYSMKPLDPASDYHIRDTIARAKRFHWPPPLAWDDIDNDHEPAEVEHIPEREYVDELMVDLALEGRPLPRRMTSREAEIVITALHERKLSDARIGEMTGITERNVLRIRLHRLGLLGIPKQEQRSNMEERSYDMAHRAGLEKAA
jgi:hypothetical protein